MTTTSAAMMEAPTNETSMDFEYMSDLLLDGCWLEASADGSNFLLQQSPPFSSPLFDPSFSWPALETNEPTHVEDQHESQEAPLGNTQLVSQSQNMVNVVDGRYNNQSETETHSVVEGTSDGVKRWWIAPTCSPGLGPSIMEKLIRALKWIKQFNWNKDMLIQIWVPVPRGDRPILSANNLPFSLDSGSENLARYREISEGFQFSAEEDSKELVPGLPGRVFRDKVPEWTPDVRFFRSDEYPRVEHAREFDICGTLAVPIFEQGSRTCLGVIEVVMTTQQINYVPQLESVCKALEVVDLTSLKHSSIQNAKARDKSYEAALPEIQEVLRSACHMHKLPLAQTWVSCFQQGKDGCRHSEDNYLHCISPVEQACYVGDPSVRFFHEACMEHHLLKGQGVAGKAFMINQPFFSTDITMLSKTDYPLSHHARLFGLRAAVAIRLRSIYSSADDYVLEFFLPVNCNDSEEQKNMLISLSIIIQRCCRSLRVITDKELERTSSSVEVMALEDSGFARTVKWSEPQHITSVASLEPEEKSSETVGGKFSDLREHQEDSILKGNIECDRECSPFVEGNLSSVGISKTGEKRRAKADKTITLEVLRQYFPGSLKDAAKNIGVCTTTLKRVCRQHGIKRWPSRKIKKVGHSLQKLQLVIDSVQGASGASFKIDSFYSNFPDLASPNLSGASLVSALNQSENPNSLSIQPDLGPLSPEGATKSLSSSCSQGSLSSHSCSSMPEQQPHTSDVACNKDPVVGKDSADVVLKRIRSEAELKSHSENKAKLFPRSLSQETLGEHTKTEYQSYLLKTCHKATPKEDAHRVKVTYGDEKTRFRMPKSWSYEHLLQEIARRFNVSDMSKFDVKYLDDDLEWVLLTCDADLEECIDVCLSSESSTIKLCIQASSGMRS